MELEGNQHAASRLACDDTVITIVNGNPGVEMSERSQTCLAAAGSQDLSLSSAARMLAGGGQDREKLPCFSKPW